MNFNVLKVISDEVSFTLNTANSAFGAPANTSSLRLAAVEASNLNPELTVKLTIVADLETRPPPKLVSTILAVKLFEFSEDTETDPG